MSRLGFYRRRLTPNFSVRSSRRVYEHGSSSRAKNLKTSLTNSQALTWNGYMFLREWIAIFVVFGFLGSLTLIEKYSRVSNQKIVARQHEIATRPLTIHLTGAVKKPGIYTCEPGSSLKNLLDGVGLTASANRKKIPFKKILFTSQKIEIPEKKGVGKNFSLEEN